MLYGLRAEPHQALVPEVLTLVAFFFALAWAAEGEYVPAAIAAALCVGLAIANAIRYRGKPWEFRVDFKD